MRDKSGHERKDLYARTFAASQAVDLLVYSTQNWGLTVEGEDMALWDDVVIRIEGIVCFRYQVKRQLTELDESSLTSLLEKMASEPGEFHLVIPSFVEVKLLNSRRGGRRNKHIRANLRALHELCRRIQQDGAQDDLVLHGLQEGERIWLDFMNERMDWSDSDALAILKKFHIDLIGLEANLNQQALRALRTKFPNYEHAWLAIHNFILDKDGAVIVDASAITKHLMLFKHASLAQGASGQCDQWHLAYQ